MKAPNPASPESLLLAHCHEILLLVDGTSLAIRAVNPGALRHLGYSEAELIGRPITDIECALADVFFWEEVRQGIAPEVRDAEAAYLMANGELLSATKHITRAHDGSGCLVICATPVGQLRRAEAELADMSAHLRATLEATADGILLVNRQGGIVNMNQRFSCLWQIPAALLLAHDDQAILDYLASCMADPESYRRRMAEIRPDGEDETHDILELADGRYFEQKSRPARQNKLIIGRVFSFTDITERKHNEARLQLAASVFTHAQEGIMITDPAGTIVEVNDTFSRITGYSRAAAVGQNARLLSSGRQGPEFYAQLWHALTHKGHWQGEIWNRRQDGSIYAELLNITAVRDAHGKIRHYVALFSDITASKEHQSQLERIAHYDALTGVPNRVLLADRLRQAIARTRRDDRLMALVYLDLDGFKEVNDTHGHETGDELLIAIAQRLNDALRAGDTLARLGGDEFVAVLTDLGSIEECKKVLERLLQAAAAPLQIKGIPLQLSASLGVTLYPHDGSDADTLLRHADQAMYQAKQAGKNRYHLFDPERDRQAKTHWESVSRLTQALAQGEFELYYQPKVHMRRGEVVGAEALLRWRHPERGLVAPGEFLPVLEGTELIARIGDWALDTALAQMRQWRQAGLALPVSVNIAAHHLQCEDFLPRLRDKLARYPDIPPAWLELEVLETAALEGITHVSRVIEGCRALGVAFSLDDFGTGYSSLTYLKRLPASVLKIDQSFVRDMLWDTEDLAIVEGVIGLAAAFHRHVIAEGVETLAHGELLLRLGCEVAQGYGIARPMPAAALTDWVRVWQAPPGWRADHLLPLSREDMGTAYAEVELRHWCRNLELYLGGSLPAPPPAALRHCGFGQWCESHAAQRYRHLPLFAQLGELHARLHTLGERLLAAHEAGDTERIATDLAALTALRDRIAQGLAQLPRAHAASRPTPQS
ncbi:MAG: EAL domain-containing protein [Azovibrio sp.]|nr:EAL domain-containing protein [Azovibrio sp.]